MSIMETADRAEQMRRLLERREREQLTYRQAAALEPGVTVNQLFWWRRRLFGRSSTASAAAASRARGFVRLVEAQAAGADERVEIALTNQRRLIVSAELSDAVLSRLVRLLERC